MQHTFLFEEGEWVANGSYTDENSARHPATGSTKISHTDRGWINAGSMMMLSGTGLVTFENRYEITPFAEGADHTPFTAENPMLGSLAGEFVIVGDSILAVSSSADGSVTAAEYLRMIGDDSYENRGFVLKEGRKIAAWELDLHKE